MTKQIKDLVTIVVPCKDEQDYIGHMLDSVAQQQGIAGTQIIIADKSDDCTREVIKIKQKELGLNIKIVEGGPVSIAKNNGAKLAKTPYILFIDSDVRFFNDRVIQDTLDDMITGQLDLLGLRVKCYDNDFRASAGFAMFNFVNRIMSRWIPFAVGAYMLTRRDRFEQLGGFPAKYVTSEDFFLSKMYSAKKFKLSRHYFGQDSRRFKKMGYFGMTRYLIKNFLNRNNEAYWTGKDFTGYWD